MISIDDFKKIEVKIGHILSAEKVEGAEKLLKLSVDFGLKPSAQKVEGSSDHPRDDLDKERDIRQIISGIAEYFPDPAILVGKKCPFATNLEHRTIRSLVSEGMIMAVGNADGFFSLLEAHEKTPPGSTVK